MQLSVEGFAHSLYIISGEAFQRLGVVLASIEEAVQFPFSELH